MGSSTGSRSPTAAAVFFRGSGTYISDGKNTRRLTKTDVKYPRNTYMK
jgi:predicted nucleic acid-binding Zn ribbon protein